MGRKLLRPERPICEDCGIKPAKPNGAKYWYAVCSTCRNKPYRKYKGNTCDFCGFVPIDLCQLDVDHKDGNHQNNDPINLQTLCANCHRLKTKLNKDGVYQDRYGQKVNITVTNIRN